MLVFELWSAQPDDTETCVAFGTLTVADIMEALDFDVDRWLADAVNGSVNDDGDAGGVSTSTHRFCLDLEALSGKHEGLLLDPASPAQLFVEVSYSVQPVFSIVEKAADVDQSVVRFLCSLTAP